jgi:hypothetical protein
VIDPTYRHLERQLRLFGLTLNQLTQLAAAALGCYLLFVLLPHGLPGRTTLALVIPLGPSALAYGAQGGDFSLGDQVAVAHRWVWRSGIYDPGATPNADGGLVITPEPGPHAAVGTPAGLNGRTVLEELWD